MSARDVLIRLRLDDTQFKAKIAAAAAQTKAFGTEAAVGAGKGAKGLGLLSSSYATVGFAAGAAAVAAVRASADFEQGMANVRATGAASEKQLLQLEQAALQMGRTTVYSSTEAADGMEALLKAGLSANDVIGGGLKGSFALAAAGGLEVGEAAETAAAAMAQFSLSGKDVPHIADLLAAGAGKANGDVRDLGQALNQAGLIAAGAGASIEETTGTLAAFAKAGLLGSDAGTSLKTMLQRLQAPSAEAAGLMKDLGISAYDANGQFVGLAAIAGQLTTAFEGKTQAERNSAMATIFGSDAVRAANVLYNEGEGGIKKWTKAVDDAGYAADVAGKKTDTLKGDLDKMKNSWRAVFEGSGTSDGLRPAIQQLDDLADSLGKALEAWDKFGDKVLGETRDDGPLEQFKRLQDARTARTEFGVSNEVFIKFKTEGAADAIKDAAAVAAAANLTPEQVRSTLELIGWSPQGIDTVLTKINQIDDREVQSYLSLLGVPAVEAQADAVDADMTALDNLNPMVSIFADGDPAVEEAGRATDAATEYANGKYQATLDADPGPALGSIKRVIDAYNKMPKGLTAGIATGGAIVSSYASGGRARGAIRGPGGPMQDSIPAMLSNGEHVLTASDVRKAGGQAAIYAMRQQIQRGQLRFAHGGETGYSHLAKGWSSGDGPQVQISFRNVSFDLVSMRASVGVIAEDVAGRVLAEQVFDSTMGAHA